MAAKNAATWIAFRAIVKRSLAVASRPSPSPRAPLETRLVPWQRCLSQPRTFSTSCYRPNAHNSPQDTHSSQHTINVRQSQQNRHKRKPSTKRPLDAATTSLRKVAVEAQFSRGSNSRRELIRGSGKLLYIDPEVPTKDITAYCAAETYDLSLARAELYKEGYQLDPLRTGLGEQVLHVQTPNYLARDDESGEDRPQGPGDVFVFPSGCVVTWNVPEPLSRTIVTRFLPTAAGTTGHLDRMEAEDMEYIEDPSTETSKIVGDTILLGTKPSASSAEDAARGTIDVGSSAAPEPNRDGGPASEMDTVLAKIAFSSALARSTKLAVLEESLSAYFASTRSIPSTLSSGRPIRYTRRHILRKTGELLSIRAQLNLYSELTDSLPDLFWDSRHELGLEGYYEMLGRSLDVGVRIKVLNEKMDYAGEIAAVLRERLSEKHSAMLEWMIIGLICIEVGFGVVHLVREKEELEDVRRTRVLAERWLEAQLGEDALRKD